MYNNLLKTKIVLLSNILKCDMIGMSQFILLNPGTGLPFVRLLHFHFTNKKKPLTGTVAKCDVPR